MSGDMGYLIAQLRAARERWVELGGSKAVRIRRPAEAEIGALVKTIDGKRQLVVELAEVQRYVTGWRGFTEADLLGAGIGNADALEFDAAVWSEVVADRMAWLKAVAEALLESVVSHTAQSDVAAGNSSPTSTPTQQASTGAND